MKIRDMTADMAMDKADKEYKQMARIALILRNENRPYEWELQAKAKFTGIFKHLLTDTTEELIKIARGKCYA